MGGMWGKELPLLRLPAGACLLVLPFLFPDDVHRVPLPIPAAFSSSCCSFSIDDSRRRRRFARALARALVLGDDAAAGLVRGEEAPIGVQRPCEESVCLLWWG